MQRELWYENYQYLYCFYKKCRECKCQFPNDCKEIYEQLCGTKLKEINDDEERNG